MFPVYPAVDAYHHIVKLKTHVGVKLRLEKYHDIEQRRNDSEKPQTEFLLNGQVQVDEA